MYPGIDIIKIERFALACERQPKIRERVFTERERADLDKRPTSSWAARFAGKEAVLKSMGTGLTGLSWHDVEILTAKSGEPQVYLSPKAESLVQKRGGSIVRLSLSHEREYAVAMAVLV
ncbi:holo-ACP synthase [Desulfitobacterium sp.]|uniref:holo-ACP synthase n=1 Tax=Desulfitobacterium sp. TaxID=49981 RepID=UPI002B207ADC|nr:holo-ACP synthase [Desulfitobacterium sp.]MEA4901771.1 holo-ACP synthase [Desulfitobacterium sp.]